MWGPQVRSTTGAAKLAEPLVSTLKPQMSVRPCVRVSVRPLVVNPSGLKTFDLRCCQFGVTLKITPLSFERTAQHLSTHRMASSKMASQSHHSYLRALKHLGSHTHKHTHNAHTTHTHTHTHTLDWFCRWVTDTAQKRARLKRAHVGTTGAQHHRHSEASGTSCFYS